MKQIIIGLTGWLLTISAYAAQYHLPHSGNTVGTLQSVTAKRGDTLNRLAVRHGVGYNEMLKANRKWRSRKIPAGTTLTLPTKYRLPSTTHNGIVINLADMRLFYYPGNGTVHTFPVAVGKRGWSTPRVRTSVVAKHRNPTWTPPKSIRREAARKGRRLRKVYPAGPNNPLGTRALRLGISGYLIHGTNKPWSIGKRVSHGCIRMRRTDVETLYSLVSVNTSVRIVSEGTRLSYPDSPSQTYAKAPAKTPKPRRVAKTRTATQKATKRRVKGQHGNPHHDNSSYHHQRKSPSYVTGNGLDYQRLLRDIETGNSQPIDLSGI